MMAKNPTSSLSRRLASATRRLLATKSMSLAEAPPSPSPPSSSTAAAKKAAAADGERPKDWKPLYRRLSVLGGQPEGSVSRALNKWVGEGKSVRVNELIGYVKELRKHKRFKHALEVIDWMTKTKGMNLSNTNHAVCLDLISKVKGIDAAEDYFSKLPEPAKNERTYGALLNCYCSEKNADKAIALHEKMKELKLASNTLVHNNLMSLYMKLGQPEKVPAILREMKANNIAPDNFTYCILMSSYAAVDDMDSVERVVNEMEEGDEVTLNWNAYSTLAGIYNSAGLFEKAKSALQKLEDHIDGSDRVPFHFLISLYAGSGNLAEVNRVWNLLTATFRKQTNASYFTLLQALNKLDDIAGMKQRFEEWESSYASYDMKLANLMIGAYLRKDMVEEAISLSERAKKKGRGFDFKTYELFMNHYLKNREVKLAFEWLDAAATALKQGGWKLDGDQIYDFLKYYEETKDVEGAEKLCKILKALGCLNLKAYELLLRTYVAAGRKAASMAKRMEEDRIKMTPNMEKLLKRVSTKT